MSWLFIAGGAPMLVIVVFGLVGIVAATRFALSPTAQRLAYLKALGIAIAASAIAGVAVDLAAVGLYVGETGGGDNLAVTLVVGVAESMAPAILGFANVSIVALLAAVGCRRLVA